MGKLHKHLCPYCENRISLCRKLFFMSAFHPLKCPYCSNKVKLRKLSIPFLVLLVFSILFIKVISSVNSLIAWLVLIITLLLNIMYIYNAELIPADKD